jgi:hypothetical protein
MFNVLQPNNRRNNKNKTGNSFEQMVRALNEQQQSSSTTAPRSPNMTPRAPNMPARANNMTPRAPNMPARANNMTPRAPNMPARVNNMTPRAPNMSQSMRSPTIARNAEAVGNIKPLNIGSTLNLEIPKNLEEIEPVMNANQLAKLQKNKNIATRKANVTQFLYNIFTFLNQIKLYHWQTRSYSRHIASDKLFSELVEKIDEFVETYMGRYKRMYINEIPNMDMTLELENMNDEEMNTYLREVVLEYFSQDLRSLIDENDTDLANIKDEIIGKIHQTLYLFTLKNGNKPRFNK